MEFKQGDTVSFEEKNGRRTEGYCSSSMGKIDIVVYTNLGNEYNSWCITMASSRRKKRILLLEKISIIKKDIGY